MSIAGPVIGLNGKKVKGLRSPRYCMGERKPIVTEETWEGRKVE